MFQCSSAYYSFHTDLISPKLLRYISIYTFPSVDVYFNMFVVVLELKHEVKVTWLRQAQRSVSVTGSNIVVSPVYLPWPQVWPMETLPSGPGLTFL